MSGTNDMLTAANATVTLTVTDLFNAPITLTNFGADRAFESEAVEFAETVMSVDGVLNRGWVPNPCDQTFTLAPGSTFWIPLDTLITTQTINRTLYSLGGVIVLPAIGRKFTMTNGVLLRAMPMPNAGRVLEPRTFVVRWESVIPAAL